MMYNIGNVNKKPLNALYLSEPDSIGILYHQPGIRLTGCRAHVLHCGKILRHAVLKSGAARKTDQTVGTEKRVSKYIIKGIQIPSVPFRNRYGILNPVMQVFAGAGTRQIDQIFVVHLKSAPFLDSRLAPGAGHRVSTAV